MRGKYIRTKEIKEKISKSVKENPTKHWLGKKRPDISLKQKGNTFWLGKKHSLETRKKLSEQRKGDKGSNWQGGVNPATRSLRSSMEYKLWRTAVFERDSYTCVWCGTKNGLGKTVQLQADHIKPFALYPELRFAIDNGRTLCVSCHKTTDTYGGKTKKITITLI